MIELANPPVFNTFFPLNEYVELIYRKKHAFKDILIREGIGEETVEDQHCIELLSILSHFCQHLLSMGQLLKAYFDNQTVRNYPKDQKRRCMHRIKKCYDLLNSGVRKSCKDPLNVQVALNDQQSPVQPALGLTGISFDDIYRSKSTRAHDFKRMFSSTSYKMCFVRSGMRKFEHVAENYLNLIYELIIQENRNLAMSTEPSVIGPPSVIDPTHLIETLPFHFTEINWISFFNLYFTQATASSIDQLAVGLCNSWPYTPPSSGTMSMEIDWEQVRAEAERDHRMRRMRLRGENNAASSHEMRGGGGEVATEDDEDAAQRQGDDSATGGMVVCDDSTNDVIDELGAGDTNVVTDEAGAGDDSTKVEEGEVGAGDDSTMIGWSCSVQ